MSAGGARVTTALLPADAANVDAINEINVELGSLTPTWSHANVDAASMELGSLTPPTPTLLSAIRLSTLRTRIDSEGEANTLAILTSTTNRLLEKVPAASVVLISYRQERVGTAGQDGLRKFDSYTLDGQALRGIVEAATKLRAEAVWLDAWCYREGPDGYEHDDFCETLHGVISGVFAVVWLPRSKVGSRGEYPYRLWCTFEAASVQQRRLPVAIAGEGMSCFQRCVCVLGSFMPAAWADGVLDGLVRLNLGMLISVVGQVTDGFVASTMWKPASRQVIGQASGNLLSLFVSLLLWLAGRAASRSRCGWRATPEWCYAPCRLQWAATLWRSTTHRCYRSCRGCPRTTGEMCSSCARCSDIDTHSWRRASARRVRSP